MDSILDFRQGDVGFVRSAIPVDAKRITIRPFALGEATGHSHRVAPTEEPYIEMYEKDGETYVRALADVHVLHEDHDPTGATSVLPEGWEGRIQICGEYSEEEDFRRVID